VTFSKIALRVPTIIIDQVSSHSVIIAVNLLKILDIQHSRLLSRLWWLALLYDLKELFVLQHSCATGV
jgi:hypothetical protein